MRRSHKTSISKYKHIAVSKSKEREVKDKNRRDKGDRVLVTAQSMEAQGSCCLTGKITFRR